MTLIEISKKKNVMHHYTLISHAQCYCAQNVAHPQSDAPHTLRPPIPRQLLHLTSSLLHPHPNITPPTSRPQ